MTPQTQPPRPRRLIGVFMLLAVVASACSSGEADVTGASSDSSSSTTVVEQTTTTASTTTTTTEAASETTSSAAPALVDSVDWELCGQLECATVDVPADYDDPSAGTLSIAINMLRATDTDRRIGVLMINPGGPGAPGTDLTQSFAFGGYPAEITERFDVVGFDPRGVGASEPSFACGDSGDQLEILTAVDDLYDTPEEIAVGEAAVQLCVDSMGALAGRIHTDFVVRDMDEIRKAMGEEQISYLGYSYGSLIGTWYATLFPENVRAMVIDGADNPLDEQDTFEERLDSAREQIQPIEDLLLASLEACDTAACPIYNGGDPVGYYYDTAKKFDLINDANANNPDTAFLALITPLYNEASWPQLWAGLESLQERDDPSIFSSLAVFQLGDDPGAVNITAHINCLDAWALRPDNDRDEQLAESAEFASVEDELDAEFPLLAAIESNSAGTCPFYDTFAPKPLAVPLDGGGVPIIVVGNTSDPVTSFGESEELANDILANGILVEVDHPSHTVYPSNGCINDVVDAVLIDLDYPTEAISCSREVVDDAEVLAEVCLEIAPAQAPGLSQADLESVCESFVEQSFSRLGDDAVYGALYEDDADAGAALFEILRDLITAAGG